MTSRSFARRVASIAVPFAIAVLLLALLEAGCRAALRVKTGAWPQTRAEAYRAFVEKIGAAYQRHPFLVANGRPNAVLEVPGHVVHFNARGQRGAMPEMPKPPGRYRVVCEGGSTTFDLLAADDAHAWPQILADRLKAKNVDVVNAGFPGWTSVESLISLELKDVDVAPDLVVVFSGANDLQPAGHVPFARDYALGHGEILPRVVGVAPIPLRLVSRSLLVEKLLDLMQPGVSRTEGYAPAWDWKGGARKDDIPQEAVDVFARNLRSTVGVARAHGARTLLVAQAVRVRKGNEKTDDEWLQSWTPGLTPAGYKAGLLRYNAAARDVAASADAWFLDPYADGAFTDADFSDPLHFSPSGSDRFARVLAGWIESRR
jgi:lysophospholipase L1-like esterase